VERGERKEGDVWRMIKIEGSDGVRGGERTGEKGGRERRKCEGGRRGGRRVGK